MVNPSKKASERALDGVRGSAVRRVGATADPKPRTEIPRCPSHLKGEARREWKRMVDELTYAKMITRIDSQALAIYCQLWAQWVEAHKEMAKPEFEMITVSVNGVHSLSPWYRIADGAQRAMLRYLSEFGMTPASRNRIRVEPDPDDDEFELFLRRKGGE